MKTRGVTGLSTKKRHIVILVVIAVLVIGLDQATKALAVAYLKESHFSFWGDTIRFYYAENTGAWGGLGDSAPPLVRMLLLTVLPSFVLIGFMVHLLRDPAIKMIVVYALGFIVSGGTGNIIDRIRQGYVVDFMWMGIGPVGTNVFNVADMAIMLGAGLFLVDALNFKGKEKNEPKKEIDEKETPVTG
jgi:signal peptidase II